ncbi:hypothetical protein C8Q73DRAFT_351584 [Cubamyces lactineus]|nr:hypothetical protein C8Q73DRAFT_351584 [Cubamyces lactineus]
MRRRLLHGRRTPGYDFLGLLWRAAAGPVCVMPRCTDTAGGLTVRAAHSMASSARQTRTQSTVADYAVDRVAVSSTLRDTFRHQENNVVLFARSMETRLGFGRPDPPPRDE